MLVVTRKINQAVLLGENVRVVVLAVDRDQVKLGIEAPQDVHVRRAELPPGAKTKRQRPKSPS